MNKMIAVVGAGYWGKNLVRNFHVLGALGAICDRETALLDAHQQNCPGIAVYTDYTALLANESIRAVAVATPAASHFMMVKQALLAGKDVFVEKPLCLESREGQELVDLAEKKGLVLMVGHLLQYHPCVQKLQALLAEGELGKLHYVTSNRLNLGKIRREENALWSFAPHDISVILSLAGSQVPESISCTGESYLTAGIADTTLTTMRFAGGVRAHIFVSWLNPFKEQKLTVVGSNAMAVFDDTRPWSEKLVLHRQYLTWTNGQTPTPSKSKGELVVVPESEPLRNECAHFLECCSDRYKPRTDGREGLCVLQVLQAAQRSLDHDGETVKLGIGSQWPVILARPDYFADPTAVVDAGAIIGAGTKIWHFAHVMKGAQLGEKCILGQNVFIANDVKIGNNVKIQNNVSVYTGTVVEDDVFLGPSCVLTNVTNPRSEINRHTLYERTLLKKGCSIGANATVLCGTTVGRYAFVAASAVVTKDVPDYGLMVGTPARRRGWMSRHGLPLPTPGPDGVMKCPEAGLRYKEVAPEKVVCLDVGEDAPLPLELRKGETFYRAIKTPTKP